MTQKITRQEEEKQTLRKFIENQGEKFHPGLVTYSGREEPCDVSYKGIDYQITYGNRKLLEDIRKTISGQGKYCGIINHSSMVDYVKEVLEAVLKSKKYKSDEKITLLVEAIYTSYGLFSEVEAVFRKYFKDNEQRLSGLWQHIFVVFSGGNIKLR